MRSRILVAVLGALVALTLPRAATAEGDKAVAQRAYNEGKRLYDVGEFAKALDAFKRAYLAYEEPSFIFNMAQCYRQLGDKEEAIRTYRSYLRNVPDARNRDEVKRIVAELETALQHEREAAAARARAAATPPQGTMAPGHAAAAQTDAAHVAPHVDTTSAPVAATTSEDKSALALTATAPPPAAKKKSRWWIWPVVGAVAAAAAVGVAVGVTQSQSSEPALSKVSFP